MRSARAVLVAVAASVVTAGPAVGQTSRDMTFFITSVNPGKGADLGGLAGADAHCQKLAEAAGVAGRTWRAYLSTQGPSSENARDRIAPQGQGMLWRNAKGVLVARNVMELQAADTKLGREASLTEKGESPQRHDILTGSQADGTTFQIAGDKTCNNWTSSTTGSAQLGHYDRQGGGDAPTSWNSAHVSRGCSMDALRSTGGDGLFYCFATK
jgi:hypothetical protein